jgi:hypothetical protein
LQRQRRSDIRTTVLAYVIAAVGLLMLSFGAWGWFVLKNAEIDVALTDEAIAFGLIGGGFAMIGVRASLAPTTGRCEKYQSSLDGSLKPEGKQTPPRSNISRRV